MPCNAPQNSIRCTTFSISNTKITFSSKIAQELNPWKNHRIYRVPINNPLTQNTNPQDNLNVRHLKLQPKQIPQKLGFWKLTKIHPNTTQSLGNA
jgi:hypothetical protein